MRKRSSFRTRLVLLMAVLLFFSYPAVIFAVESDYTVPSDTIVYVTETGDCYHRDGCPYLKSRIPMTIAEAVQGYRACSRCHPDTMTGTYRPVGGTDASVPGNDAGSPAGSDAPDRSVTETAVEEPDEFAVPAPSPAETAQPATSSPSVPQTTYAPVSTAIGEDSLFPLFCLAAGTLLGGGLVSTAGKKRRG